MTAAALTIGGRVKARLERAGLSLNGAVELSQTRGAPVANGTWHKLSNGDGEESSLAVLRNVARTLDMTLSELLGEDAAVTLVTRDIAPSPLNPRKSFDDADIEEMAGSLKTYGQLQPIIVRDNRRHGDPGQAHHYEIVVGERRWRGASRAKLATMRAIVRPVTDGELIAIALTENSQRVDMKPLETADAFLAAKREGYKPKDIAVMAKRGARVVQEYISVAEHLCAKGREAIEHGSLTISQAIAIVGERDPKQQYADIEWAINHGGGEDAIRARITKRKEAEAAPLFGSDAPPVKAPKAKEWPKPDRSGVYDIVGEPAFEFLRGRHFKAAVHILQIDADVWIGGYVFTTPPSASTTKKTSYADLTAARTWPQQWLAMRWTMQDVIGDTLTFLRTLKDERRDAYVQHVNALINEAIKALDAKGAPADEAGAIQGAWLDRLSRVVAGDPTPRDANASAPADDYQEDQAVALDQTTSERGDWHEGLTFVYSEDNLSQRPVVRRSLHDMVRYLCERRGFVSSKLKGIEDIERWKHDDDGALYILLPGGDQPALYIADDGR